MMPGIVPSVGAASASRRRGRVTPAKTVTAATMAAVTSRSFFTWLGDDYRPACDLRPAALSVRSQVNSGSVRPKCPKAAVFL